MTVTTTQVYSVRGPQIPWNTQAETAHEPIAFLVHRTLPHVTALIPHWALLYCYKKLGTFCCDRTVQGVGVWE